MSKLSAKTTEWLQEAEQTYLDGMPSVTDPNRKRLMQIGLDAVQDELKRRADQKKSEKPKESNRQEFFKKQAQEYRERGHDHLADKVEQEVQESHQDEMESAQAFSPDRRIIGRITDAPVIPIPAVFVELASGTKPMTQVEIMNMLKTWFKRVACSKAMEENRPSDAYRGSMGQDTYKLFQGWRTIYDETQEGAAWPPLVDCFPGWNRASQLQKVNAEMLWRWATNEK